MAKSAAHAMQRFMRQYYIKEIMHAMRGKAQSAAKRHSMCAKNAVKKHAMVKGIEWYNESNAGEGHVV